MTLHYIIEANDILLALTRFQRSLVIEKIGCDVLDQNKSHFQQYFDPKNQKKKKTKHLVKLIHGFKQSKKWLAKPTINSKSKFFVSLDLQYKTHSWGKQNIG
jgi:hypothetical protein